MNVCLVCVCLCECACVNANQTGKMGVSLCCREAVFLRHQAELLHDPGAALCHREHQQTDGQVRRQVSGAGVRVEASQLPKSGCN